MALSVLPLTPDRWDELVSFFGPNGAYSNCWCAWYRVRAKDFDDGPANRRVLRRLTRDGAVPGLLAYDGSRPVGWVSIAPREQFERILRSRVLDRTTKRASGPLCASGSQRGTAALGSARRCSRAQWITRADTARRRWRRIRSTRRGSGCRARTSSPQPLRCSARQGSPSPPIQRAAGRSPDSRSGSRRSDNPRTGSMADYCAYNPTNAPPIKAHRLRRG